MKNLLQTFATIFDCMIIEEHLSIFYHSCEQSFDETFFTVMHGEIYLFEISEDILENWVTPAHLLSMFKGCY
jgi:hypothetical protein